MRISRPSPAMAVASVALFVSLGGTSVAAVNFARNADKVDGKDARGASVTLSQAAGDVVATERSGPNKGRIPGKFVSGVARTRTFGRSDQVADNAQGAPVPIATASGLGTLTAQCVDQNGTPAVEDPATVIAFTNQSGQTINLTKRVGVGDGAVQAVANATLSGLNVAGSNTFEVHVELAGQNLIISGVVRQDGRGTAAASCLVYGTLLIVRPS
jgi:hypothetical protein